MGVNMSKKSDMFEVSITENAKIIAPNISFTHTGGNVHLSDIKIENSDSSTHIEVKMTGAQFGTPRLKYENEKWSGIECNYITNNISKLLNESENVGKLVDMMVDETEKKYSTKGNPWIGYKRTHYRDHREYHKGIEVETENIDSMLCYDSIQHILKNVNENQTILWNEDSDEINDMVKKYYIEKGASYIQVGDNFYALDHSLSESFGLKDDIPYMEGESYLTVRFSFRKTHKWIEIIPTLKYKNMTESKYSLKPNTKKEIPFKE